MREMKTMSRSQTRETLELIDELVRGCDLYIGGYMKEGESGHEKVTGIMLMIDPPMEASKIEEIE